MSPITIINHLSIKHGKMDEFIEAQRSVAAEVLKTPRGLIGGRIYRSVDGESVVIVSQFESESAQREITTSAAFKEHLKRMQALVDASSPQLFEEVYTYGSFK